MEGAIRNLYWSGSRAASIIDVIVRAKPRESNNLVRLENWLVVRHDIVNQLEQVGSGDAMVPITEQILALVELDEAVVVLLLGQSEVLVEGGHARG